GDRRSEPVRESVAESALRRSGVVVAIPTAVLTSGLSTGSGRRLRPRGRERLHEEDGIEGAAWIGSEVLLLRVSIRVVRETVERPFDGVERRQHRRVDVTTKVVGVPASPDLLRAGPA